MQWLIDIIAEKVITEIGIPPVFIDRGDPASFDFTSGSFMKDWAWHDLDLSGIIPAGAKAASIFIRCVGGVANVYIWFRMKGQTNEFNRSELNSPIQYYTGSADLVIPLPDSRIIQYKCVNKTFYDLSLAVKGWWL